MWIIELINSNGVIVLLGYMLIVLVAGTVPPLPRDAGFFATWGYRLLKGIALNSRAVGQSLGLKIPELQFSRIKKPKTDGENKNGE